MKKIDVPVTFGAPELDSSSSSNRKFYAVLNSAVKARGGSESRCFNDEKPYWDANHFGLNRSSIFSKTSREGQSNVLRVASRNTLEEAYYIEKSGMSFTAKMALMSRTTQERMLYSLFSADETIHLHHVSAYLEAAPTNETKKPFISLLSKMIQEGDRETLVFLIQVVLEGWGIIHYHHLAQDCQDDGLRESLRMILRDEARHHGSGMVLSREVKFTTQQRDYVLQTMIEFLRMVQCGPVALVSALETVTGPLASQAKLKLHEELGSEKTTQEKLDLIRSLIIQGGAQELIAPLEKANAFRSTIKQCAGENT